MNPMEVAQLTQGFAVTVINAATGTGTTNSVPFVVQMRKAGLQRTINFTCTGTYAVCTMTLQQSVDAGANFVNIGAAMDFFANKAGNLASLNGIVAFTPGVIYRLSVTSFTGTSITTKLAIT